MIQLFSIQGTPKPQPRPRFFSGRAVSTPDALTRAWKDKVAQGCLELDKLPKGGAWRVEMMFRMPTKDATRHGYPHTQTPDSDNLAKLVLDAMQDAGLLPNDSAVSQLEIFKTWSPLERAGVSVIISKDETKPSYAPTPNWLTNKKPPEGG